MHTCMRRVLYLYELKYNYYELPSKHSGAKEFKKFKFFF